MSVMTQNNLTLGVAAALAAGLMWGLVFVVPLLLPDYPATLLTFGRYLAFGLVTLPIAWWQRAKLLKLTRADWWLATRLSIVGNIAYYQDLCTTHSFRRDALHVANAKWSRFSVTLIDEETTLFSLSYPLFSAFLTAFGSLRAPRTDYSHRLGSQANFIGRFE